MIARDLVLLHGWGSGAGVWRELAAWLAPAYRVHVPELPGYGATALCRPYTLEKLADAIARTAPRHCAAIGWSLGGQVALAWARRAPRQVERLALFATTPRFVNGPGWALGMARSEFDAFARALEDDPAGTLDRFSLLATQGDLAARRVTRLLRAARSGQRVPDPAALTGGLEILRDADLRAGLRSIGQPTLVVHGARDRLVPSGAGRYLGRRVAAGRVLVLRGTAHVPFLSKPGPAARALRAFLDA